MTSSYPGSLDSFTNPTGGDNLSTSVGGRTHSAMHADLNDAMENVQGELGVNPSGSAATVAARFTAVEAALAQPTAWASFTPTWSGSTTNPTLGTGGQIRGRYRRFGYNVEGRIEIVTGSGASAGSGTYFLSLPGGVTAATPLTSVSHYTVGSGWIFSGGSSIQLATLNINAADPTKFRVTIAGNLWTSGLPLTSTDNQASFTFAFETQESAFG